MSNRHELVYYYKKNRYINILVATGKWKDLFVSKEAFFSVAMAIVLTWMAIVIFLGQDIGNFLAMTRSIVQVVISGFLSLMGFLIAGLSVLTTALGSKMLGLIDKDKNFDALMSILFTFYFVGSIVGLTIILMVLLFILTYTPYTATLFKVASSAFIVSYFFMFSLISSVMLIGTCLRMTILKYSYDKRASEEDK